LASGFQGLIEKRHQDWTGVGALAGTVTKPGNLAETAFDTLKIPNLVANGLNVGLG
jgi:hypothetical protein